MKQLFIYIALLTLAPALVHAVIQGSCSDCHTMHNSQDGQLMANINGGSGPNPALTKANCLGCHAQGGGQALVSIGAMESPQVLHTEGIDLAGGNFAYITGAKGSGGSDNKGHNILALTGIDNTLPGLPGGLRIFFHDTGDTVNTSNLNCAGTNGCHGYRDPEGLEYDPPLPSEVSGAHHSNRGGKLDLADSVGTSYRFLAGVKGLEDEDWQYTAGQSDHNEYFALGAPVALSGCGSTNGCHMSLGTGPPDGSISQFCATCHGNFHTIAFDGSDGIGADGTSPFIRHPSDLVLPNRGEFSQITAYDLNAPVGRTGAIPAIPSATASPGDGDAVTCLSCHVAHASDYPDMLRWDYENACLTRTSNADCGCFSCHTAKDD